jgi:ornithine cyclodeaminase/alanine dehydrogenase-like protein (mu-crystallin family)
MVLLLSRSDVRRFLPLADCIEVVERAFIEEAEGRIPAARSLGFPVVDGGFHVKVARLDANGAYVAAKLNGNFPGNRERHGLPTIQGLVLLSDADRGTPLAVIDSVEITIRRTGAATAVAARKLARAGATSLAILGCGNQGRVSIDTIGLVRPVRRVVLWDTDRDVAQRLASDLRSTIGAPLVDVVTDPASALRDCEVAVTCTPSKIPFVRASDVRPGLFLAAVGADSELKQEIAAEAMTRMRVVTDDTEQCARGGDLHHAIAAGAMTRDQVHGNLGAILAGHLTGRTSEDQAFVFDSTGTAIQDVAASALVYQRARAAGAGATFEFGT